MGPTPAELAEEQAYFDVAYKHRERRRAERAEVSSAAAHPGAASQLSSWARGRQAAARGPGEAVAFGRIDHASATVLYIGNEIIADDDREILVVNWQAPAAAPYYRASHDDPCGLVRKRTFECSGNVITDIADVVFRQLAADVAALHAADGPDAALLSELDSDRTGEMHAIVATIQAAQYELIRAPMDQLLVIEGGPGTGKTAVALHRVSWLLFNHRDRLAASDVLVVGPHPAFTKYIRTVLPALGDVAVEQQDIGQLAPAVRRGRPEPVEVSRLKGQERMADLLARALDARIGTPEPAERMQFHGRVVSLSGAEVAAAVAACRQADAPYAQRRRLLRARLLDLARQRGAPSGARLQPVDDLVERLWPQTSTPAFVRGLLGSRPRLTAAAADGFSAAEVALLHRRGADRLSKEIWSQADLALLDEAEDLINGVPRRYRHIVVDEAQDLSPMQLRCIARRSAGGSLTVVGDLAQSTGPWARDHWDDVLRHLPTALPRAVVPLRFGYRVPRQVYDLAARLLPVAAPGVEPARVVRDGPAEPAIHQVDADERAALAVTIAGRHAAAGRFVGLVCPPSCRRQLVEALTAGRVEWSSADRGALNSSINLVSPQEAKGLEFDAVVVVEPEDIVAGDDRGHRMLFVALTRTIRYLDVVCAGDPLPLSTPAPVGAEPDRGTGPPPIFGADQLDRLAEEVATVVASRAPIPLWDEVLQRAAAMLDRRAERGRPSGRHRRD